MFTNTSAMTTLRVLSVLYCMLVAVSRAQFPSTVNDHDKICSFKLITLQSCKDTKLACPKSTTGYYKLIDSQEEEIHQVYCNMDELCGDPDGGWMRVAYLNMSDPTEKCPMGFRLYEENGVKACGRHESDSCMSTIFSSKSVSYSQVCGRVYGYQKGTPDAIGQHSRYGINGHYVDGVSITRGNPRQHVWTMIGGHYETLKYANHRSTCPCSNGRKLPAFVGNHYFCESGNPSNKQKFKLYTDDLLWDGKQCGTNEQGCCKALGLPWFHRLLETTTTDDIELRICGNQKTHDEDTPVAYYEIYVK